LAKVSGKSYFELHRLPLDIQGLKPSILMGKFNQSLLHGISPDNDLFIAMFLIRLPPSMRETVASGNHKTATAMVNAADALWDALSSHSPTVAAAMTNRSRSPAPVGGKRDDKGGQWCPFKKSPPSNQDFFSFKNPGNGLCKYHNYYNARAYKCLKPCTSFH
jgi:hypothetical protein